MRILITGKRSQLGRSILKIVNKKSSSQFVFVGREELNLNSENTINYFFDNNERFDVIVNCAAYTAVERAEEEVELANQVNNLAVKQLALIAKEQNTKLIHISTDFVFDGESERPYIEKDLPRPINTYGKTKYSGEIAIQKIMRTDALIIRTSWLYSEYGTNFVKTMQMLCKEKADLKVVHDQIGSPTFAIDLASAILEIIKNEDFREVGRVTQILHYSNIGEISWYEFAQEILKKSKDCKVLPSETKQLKNKIRRPKFTALDSNKIVEEFGVKIYKWKNSLDKMKSIRRIK